MNCALILDINGHIKNLLEMRWFVNYILTIIRTTYLIGI